MQIKGLLVATALCAGTAMADFMAYSELPFPRDAIPTFTDPAEVSVAIFCLRLTKNYLLTNPSGHRLDALRLSGGTHLLRFLHKQSRLNLPIVPDFRPLRNQRVRTHGIKLQHSRGSNRRQRNNDVLLATELVLCAAVCCEEFQG
jgi:hypothetical protein